MDLAAIAETTVEMWTLIDAKLIARSKENLDPQIKATLLKEAMSLYMTHIINESKSSAPGAPPKQEAKAASEKQLAYIKDLGGDPSTVRTSYEASQYIEDLRKK